MNDRVLGGAEGSAAYDYFDDNGHGTHVAGTILGAYNGTGVAGVAPLANLLSGRVCGKFGCSSVGIIRGIEYGVAQKVDVINMSLGGPVASQAAREAVATADRAGVVVVCASGNDGQGTVSFPAAYAGSFAVGAIDSHLAKASFSNWGPELAIVAPGVNVLSSVPTGSGRESKVELQGVVNGEVKSKSFVGAQENETPVSAELVHVGLGKPEDFAGKNLRGKFALIGRGEIPFADKVKSALAAGASGVLIYNNEPGLISGALTQDGSSVGVPVAMIEQSVGQALVNSLASGQVAKASLSVARTNFSSFNGTSMASPHVAGVAALVKAANKNLTAAQVRQILSQTADRLQASPERPNEFGAGLVNAKLAVEKALSLRQGN
jgi:subtilisin family serine protease